MGDREENWRVKPFQMSPGGPFWVPPPLPTVSSDSEEERVKKQQQEQERCDAEAREREAAEKEGTIVVKDDDDKDATGTTTVYVHVCSCVSTISKIGYSVALAFQRWHATVHAVVILFDRTVLFKALQPVYCLRDAVESLLHATAWSSS
eukprot:6530-Heterococcus_DN1.PRE.2